VSPKFTPSTPLLIRRFGRILQFGGVCLDPPENGGVIDRDTAILQHKFKLSVADGKLEIPAHGPTDHLRSELSPLELLAPIPHCRAIHAFLSCPQQRRG
jgi:hypothetical protein